MSASEKTIAQCHCGAVTITLAALPSEVVKCNCSLCRKYGVLWAYPSAADVLISPDPPPTEAYAWNGRNVDFHRCRACGCITHWMPRDRKRESRGVNAHLLSPETLAAIPVRLRNGAGTGLFTD